VLILQGHRAAVWSLAYSPRGETLASGSADKSVRLWDLATWETTAILKGHRTYVHAVAFIPDSRLLALAGGDLYLKNPATGLAAVARQESGKPIAALALSPDGRLLVTASRCLGGGNSILAGEVRFWDIASVTAFLNTSEAQTRRKNQWEITPADAVFGGVALGEVVNSGGYGVWSIAFDPSGRLLAVGTNYGGVLVWDVLASKIQWRLNAATAIRALAFSSDGRLLAAAESSRVQIWDVLTGTNIAVLKGHDKQVTCVAFSPRSSSARGTILSGSQDGTVRVWDVNPLRERSVFAWPLDAVRAVAFAPDEMTAAAGGENGTVVIWDCD
jgi:WD40 repeat protein